MIDERELRFRLADVAAVIANFDGEDTDSFVSVLDHAVHGECGHVDPEEWQEMRDVALITHGEELGIV